MSIEKKEKIEKIYMCQGIKRNSKFEKKLPLIVNKSVQKYKLPARMCDQIWECKMFHLISTIVKQGIQSSIIYQKLKQIDNRYF